MLSMTGSGIVKTIISCIVRWSADLQFDQRMLPYNTSITIAAIVDFCQRTIIWYGQGKCNASQHRKVSNLSVEENYQLIGWDSGWKSLIIMMNELEIFLRYEKKIATRNKDSLEKLMWNFKNNTKEKQRKQPTMIPKQRNRRSEWCQQTCATFKKY